MKKLLCALLMAAMLVTLSAMAETAELPAPQSVEQKLEAMIPVLDSLAVSLNVDSQDEAFRQEYDPTDTHLLWNQLWVLCAEWLSNNASYRTEDGITIPADVMDACARASFGALEGDLPAIPKTSGESTVRYDAKADVYDVEPGEGDDHFMVIESYAADGDQMVVSCGVYDSETKERKGGMTARLNTAVPDGNLYPFEVMDAHAEARGDFDGLWANLCDIRYTAPEPPAEQPKAEPEPTEAPKAAKAASTKKAKAPAYVKLSTGSKGAAVKTLQQRLKKLGYDCGTADGVYGASTKNAIRYFQDAVGVKQDGVASAKLQKKLFGKKAPKYVQYVKVKKGSKGIRVEKLQSTLRKLGYTAAPVDGSYGDRIVEAVKLFQTAAGLKADGVAGEKTLKALAAKDAPECKDYIDLQKGDTGSRVGEMQRALVKLGYLSKANEKYDDTTVKAVAGFKEDYKVKGNGKSASAEAVRMMVAAANSPVDPTEQPTTEPTDQPTEQPKDDPTDQPTEQPKDDPTDDPSEPPKDDPTDDPSEPPKDDPTDDPSEQPKDDPTDNPTEPPKDDPTDQPSEKPKDDPTDQPSEQPTGGESQSDKEAEEEAARKAAEEEAARKAAEEEAARKAAEEEAARKAAEEEAARKAAEEEAARKAAEEEAARKAAEEAARKAAEEEAARKAAEEAARKAAEEEAARKAAEEQAAQQNGEG